MIIGMITGVLCFIIQDGKILLAKKKRGFGKGWWNGVGGKVNENEEVVEAVQREAQEEAGIVPQDPTFCGTLRFSFEDGTPDWQLHVFRAEEFDGEPQESEEMSPQWFDLKEIPYEEMWVDDHHWLPLLLEGKRFEGRFHLHDHKTIIDFEVREL